MATGLPWIRLLFLAMVKVETGPHRAPLPSLSPLSGTKSHAARRHYEFACSPDGLAVGRPSLSWPNEALPLLFEGNADGSGC